MPKKVWESEDEKYVMFISSLVLQWIMTFCTYQQKLKNVWNRNSNGKCWTHFWPSMEDVNLSFFLRGQTPRFIRADIDTFTDGTLSREGKKHCKTQYKINIFHIHTIKLQLASGEPPASALYIYMCVSYHWILNEALKDVMRVPAKSLWPVDQRTWGEAVHFYACKAGTSNMAKGWP